jgi:hypothetical protein
MAVYQILDNEMGSLPRMIFIVNNAKFAQHAVMAPGQLSYFSLAHGSRADFDSVDATRINTGSSDEPEFPLGRGPRQNSAFSMGFKLETSAIEVVKQQLVLVMKTTLYRDAAYRINFLERSLLHQLA